VNSRSALHIVELKRVSFLKSLDSKSLAELAESCRILHLARGDDLFVEGDACRGMFLLLTGSVKIYRAAVSGREQIITIESQGAILAEVPMLDGEVYPASCAALEASNLLLVPRDAFEGLLIRKPELAAPILRVVGKRLRHLVTLVEELSLLEVPQRLAKYLLSLADEQSSTFTLALSNQEIAGRLGTVREIVSRNLHRLENQGSIRIEGRRITIVDEDALRSLIEER